MSRRIDPVAVHQYIKDHPRLSKSVVARHFNISRSSAVRYATDPTLYMTKTVTFKCREPLRTVFTQLAFLGLTVRQIATQLNVTPCSVSAWRCGKRDPNFFAFECLCTLAGLSLKLESVK